MLSLYFMAGTALSLLLLGILGELVIIILRNCRHLPMCLPVWPYLDHQASSPLRSIIVALGLGLSCWQL